MPNFQGYAKYYDLINRDKEYEIETDYIETLINKYKINACSILELGSGTGTHAISFAKRGYQVHGVDLSLEMVEIANQKMKMDSVISNRLSFTNADIRELNLDDCFDVVLSLFHVMSYQIINSDLEKVFFTANQHLKQDGIFLFDCWYGPGVLSNKPVVRVKRVEDDKIKIYRVAEPIMYPNENLVDVNYEIIVEDRTTNCVKIINEVHKMRYLFLPELKYIAEKYSFELLDSFEYMSMEQLSFQSWNGCIIFKKVTK
ncbi:class I SAM-dependent DNA methyltransferase [Lysinibacillus sphaericus]|uniref:class I SAM-dependent DNA methyltransferase n=1 Tax=Lysinibacillus sphaericus TaxID=1421 RepID=UPI003F79F466